MAKIKLVVSATIEETFSDFIISKKTKGLAEKTLQSYQSQFQAVARHMDVKMDIAMLQKADLDAMIISMRDVSLSPPNSINSYTRTLKSFFSWCNEQGMGCWHPATPGRAAPCLPLARFEPTDMKKLKERIAACL